MQTLFSTDKRTGSIWEMTKYTKHLTRSEFGMASFFSMTNGTGPSQVKCFPISSASLYFKQAGCQGAGAHCCPPVPLTGHSLALVMLPSSMAKSPRSSPSVQASRTGQCTVMPRKKKWGDCQGSWIFCCSCFLKAFLCNHAVPFYWFRVPVATVLTEYSPVLRTAVIGAVSLLLQGIAAISLDTEMCRREMGMNGWILLKLCVRKCCTN